MSPSYSSCTTLCTIVIVYTFQAIISCDVALLQQGKTIRKTKHAQTGRARAKNNINMILVESQGNDKEIFKAETLTSHLARFASKHDVYTRISKNT